MESFIKGLSTLEGYKGQIEHIEFLPSKKEETGKLETQLLPSLQQYLDNRMIKLYKHKTDAINLVRKGENVVIATPTASGAREDGCPSCIYSSKCGNNNEPLDKQAAIFLLKELIKKVNL